MDRKLLHQGLWVCVICLCSMMIGVGIMLLTGGRIPSLRVDAAATGSPAAEPVLQSTTQATSILPSTIPDSTSGLSGVLAAQPSAPSTLSPPPSAPSTSSPSPPAATAPTSTLASPATSAALPTVVDTVLVDEFDVPSGTWPVRTQTTSSSSYVDGQYQLQINGQLVTSVSTALGDEPYRFAVDVTITRGEAGIVFLADDQSAFYCLLIRPNGTYAIQQINTAGTTTVVDWTTGAPLQREAGARNRLQVARVDGTVRFFANDVGEPFAEFVLPARNVTNHYGFLVASSDGQAQATFDNLRVERLSTSN